MKRGWQCLILLVASFAVMAGEAFEQQDVEAVIQVLAGDAMQGRKAGTQGAQMAASFIVDEFKKAGLKQYEGLDGFRHRFDMRELVPGDSKLTLNGAAIDAAQFVIYSESPQFQVKTADKMAVKLIGEKDNPRSNFGNYYNNPEDLIVLMHSTHTDFFKRIQGFLSDSKVLSGKAKGSKVFVLTDQTKVTQIEASATQTISDKNFANVVGYLPGKDPNAFVMFSAHYDHIGTIEPVDGDAIANGADDDASGVTALIMLARHFGALPQPERGLLFVAFDAEEMGTLGSRAFAKVIKPQQLVAGINMEMIGKPSKFGKGQMFLTGFERSNLGEILQKRLENSEYGVHPDPYPDMNLFFRSDNAPFARLGVPAHTFSTVQLDKDKFYHTVNDEVETLNMEHLTSAIRGIAKSVEGLVNGTDTPTRITP